MMRSSARLGLSAAAREIERDLTLAVQTDASVLLSGERGVGKRTIARALHARGRRGLMAFVPVRCGIAEPALAAQLFGDAGPVNPATAPAGAIGRALGGTLFLQDIARAGRQVQARLLDIAERERTSAATLPPPDVRVIASTEVPLFPRVIAGEFREDLFYRLNVIHISVPPLRERPEDIPALLIDILARLSADADRHMPDLSADAWQWLCGYHWPGNLSEMHRVARRLLGRSREGRRISAADLPQEIAPGRQCEVPCA